MSNRYRGNRFVPRHWDNNQHISKRVKREQQRIKQMTETVKLPASNSVMAVRPNKPAPRVSIWRKLWLLFIRN